MCGRAGRFRSWRVNGNLGREQGEPHSTPAPPTLCWRALHSLQLLQSCAARSPGAGGAGGQWRLVDTDTSCTLSCFFIHSFQRLINKCLLLFLRGVLL